VSPRATSAGFFGIPAARLTDEAARFPYYLAVRIFGSPVSPVMPNQSVRGSRGRNTLTYAFVRDLLLRSFGSPETVEERDFVAYVFLESPIADDKKKNRG